MESIHLDPIVSWILRAALAALFAAAAMHKIRDPRAFARTLADYELVSPKLRTTGAIVLVASECFVALGLMVGRTQSLAGAGALLLLGVYSAAIAINLVRGRTEIDCGCMGPAADGSGLTSGLLMRNVVLALGATATLLPVSIRSLHLIDGLTGFGGFAVLALLFHTSNLLASQPWPRAKPENAS